MADHQDTLASFMGITGASSTVATQYLEITNWTLEEAVNLFMESGGQGLGSAAPPPAPSGAAASSYDAYEDDVRAPDPSKRQRLFGDAFDSLPIRRLHEQYRDFAAESIAAINAASRAPTIDSVFAGDLASEASRSRDLSSLFQPPVKLMFNGTYSEARTLARNSGKWLLVNIQDEIVFASHMLNRDTWSDDVVQNVVESGYVFWQNSFISENGKKFCTLYQVDREELPIIAIVNPKTGEIVQKYTGFVDAQDLTERLSDFSFSQTFEGDEGAETKVKAQPRDITEASEEDQLAAAIAASMEGVEESDGNGDSDADFDQDEEKPAEVATEAPAPEPMPQEPSDTEPNVTRVQIRGPDGSRLTRRFLKSDPVALLWRFVQEQFPESRTRPFELRTAFPPAAIPFHETETIADRKLENASLMVKWI